MRKAYGVWARMAFAVHGSGSLSFDGRRGRLGALSGAAPTYRSPDPDNHTDVTPRARLRAPRRTRDGAGAAAPRDPPGGALSEKVTGCFCLMKQ